MVRQVQFSCDSGVHTKDVYTSESQGCSGSGSMEADTENTTFKANKMGEYLGSKTIATR